MASTNRKASFLATMAWEGRDKLSTISSDPGNWTGGRNGIGKLIGSKYGVSAMVMARMGKTPATLTEDDALKVFVDGYWTPIGGDIMAAGVDHCVSDDAYNAGAGGALGRWRRGGWTKGSDPIATIHAYSARRLSFLEGLRSFAIFGKGWVRRVAGVEVESVTMAHGAGAPLAIAGATLADHLTVQSHEADARASGSRIVASLAGAAAIAAPAAAPHGGLGMIAVAVIAAAAAVHQLYSGHVQAARRDALGDAADKA